MAQSFPETAHRKTDLKKYHSNFDAIDWTIKKKEKVHTEECALLVNVRHGCTCDGAKDESSAKD